MAADFTIDLTSTVWQQLKRAKWAMLIRLPQAAAAIANYILLPNSPVPNGEFQSISSDQYRPKI